MARRKQARARPSGAGAVRPWDPYSLIQPDSILPSQGCGDRLAARTGELGLLWAVLSDGVQTYCSEIRRGSTASLAYREAERWIARPSSDALTSFSSLCELFAIDARRMRRALLRLRDRARAGATGLSSIDAA